MKRLFPLKQRQSSRARRESESESQSEEQTEQRLWAIGRPVYLKQEIRWQPMAACALSFPVALFSIPSPAVPLAGALVQ